MFDSTLIVCTASSPAPHLERMDGRDTTQRLSVCRRRRVKGGNIVGATDQFRLSSCGESQVGLRSPRDHLHLMGLDFES